MNKIPGAIKIALIDIDRATEFTGDDVDRFSKLVNLGGVFDKVQVFVPALDAAAVVSLYLQKDQNEDTVPVQLQAFDDDATGHFAHATTSGSGSIVITFECGAVQFLRVHCGADQAADRTFYVRGC